VQTDIEVGSENMNPQEGLEHRNVGTEDWLGIRRKGGPRVKSEYVGGGKLLLQYRNNGRACTQGGKKSGRVWGEKKGGMILQKVDWIGPLRGGAMRTMGKSGTPSPERR